MKIENKLTLAHLKQNKRRTIITVIGIVLSTLMFTTIITSCTSLLNLIEKTAIVTEGNYHFYVKGGKEETLEVLKNNKNVSDFCFKYNADRDESSFLIENGSARHTSIGDFAYGDEKYLTWMTNTDLVGRIPKAENEIMISQEIIDKNNLSWQVGDTVELTSIYRYFFDEEYHTKTDSSGEYQFGEKYDVLSKSKYKIVGIIPFGNTIYRFRDLDNKNGTYIYARMNNLNFLTASQIRDVYDELHIDREKPKEAAMNSMLLLSHLSFDKNSLLSFEIVGVVVLVILITMACAVIMIYNAFSMSYAEKVKYLGMLSSVGATKAQKLKSSYFEAIVLGLIGVSAGFVLGIIMSKIATLTLGKTILKAGFVGYENMKFNLVVPLFAIAIVVALSVITILISVYKPAKMASEITPIEAIRQANEFNAKATRSPFLIKKAFGYEGILAYKNQKRNGRRGKLITSSIAIAVILLLVCNYGADISIQSAGINDDLPYQIYVQHDGIEHEDFENFLDNTSEIDDWYHIGEYSYYTNEQMSIYDFVNSDSINAETVTKKYRKMLKTDVQFCFFAVEDEAFNEYCEKNGIDPKSYYENEGQNLKCVVMNNMGHKQNGKPVFNENLLGGEFFQYSTDADAEEFNESLPHFVFTNFAQYDSDNYICHLGDSKSISCYFPYSAYINHDDVSGGEYGIKTQKHKVVKEKIEYYFEDFDELNYVFDHQQISLERNTIWTIIKSLVYSLIALIIVIISMNIINTISTSTELRKREFAMLKSVGTTPKGFKKMIALESIFYAIKALLFAIPISVLLCYILNIALGDGTIPFDFNIPLCILASITAFLVVIISMLLGLKNTNENSIIEDLK